MQEVGNFTENTLKGAVSELVKKCLNNDDYHEVQKDISQRAGRLGNGWRELKQ